MAETVREKALMKKPFICTKIQTTLPQLCPAVNTARRWLIFAANLNREEETSAEGGIAFIKLPCEHACDTVLTDD